jgi:Fic family protein
LAHVQFETLHPFLDGKGRVGRLLVSLLLSAEVVLREPMLYLSLFLKQHRSTYYDLLQSVRVEGGWTSSSRGLPRPRRVPWPRPRASCACLPRIASVSGIRVALQTLVQMGIIREITGGQRNRLFAYSQVLQILSEGTES